MAFSLHRMLKPHSVALIGASGDAHSISGQVARSALSHAADTNVPSFYLVNPHHRRLYDHDCVSAISELPESVDLVIILTPWAATPECLEALALRDVGGVVCIAIATDSSIAGVLWQSRKSLLIKLRKQLTRLHIGLIGPSSFGVQLPHVGLNASLMPNLAQTGGLALITQSEAVCTVAAEYCAGQALGLRALISLGDTVDINATELLDYFANDSSTTLVALQIDAYTVDEAELWQEFLSALRTCTLRKPVVLWIQGAQRDRATQIDAHGALSVASLEAFCEATHLKQFVSAAKNIEMLPSLIFAGNSAALLTLTATAATDAGFTVAPLSALQVRAVKAQLGSRRTVSNPLDLGRDADPLRYANVARALAKTATASTLVFCHHPNAFSDGYAIAQALCNMNTDAEPESLDANQNRVRIAIFTGPAQAGARALLRANGVAAFDQPDVALRTLGLRTQQRAATVFSNPTPMPDAHTLMTASGMRLLLRDIQSTDEAQLQRGFLRLTADEVRMRFMFPLKALTHDLAARLTQLDPSRDIALVLAAPEPAGAAAGQAQIYAVVRASRTPSYRHRKRCDAEFAIVIPQALSGQGLGQVLMLALMQRCRESGIQRLWGDVLAENAAMLALARKLGFKVEKHPDTGHLVRVTRTI
jgi:acetyltransferase